MLPIDIAIGVIVLWLILGMAGLFLRRNSQFVNQVIFPAGALTSLALAGAGLAGLADSPNLALLPLGLPDLPFHLRLDPLSAFFLVLLGGTVFGVSLFSAGYLRNMPGATLGPLCLQYHVFIASMTLVLLADDGYSFMVAWESMALSSYFLVITNHRIAEVRSAGFLYLLTAHLGALSILLCFGVLQAGTGDYTFAAMRHASLTPFWATTAFLLALVGFGAKAGLLPLHVWLPEAHPAAPSHVSALMSGVMLKTAIYGLLRVTFDLLQGQIWWWGVLTLAIGLLTTLFGVLFAAVQTDMKRLLAYSSIENMGLILVGIGLAILFNAYGMGLLAALALTASLYHALNHAFFKGLLFLGTGTVLHATKERNLGHLGGLIHPMPWVAFLCLVGVLGLAGLPPLNGFVSEWLLLQSFLLTPGLPHSYLNMLVPVAAAAIALASALAGYVMVKFFGVIFLGQPREAKLRDAQDANRWERLGMGWLALVCVLLGLFPAIVIGRMDAVNRFLLGRPLLGGGEGTSWLWLAPISPERASYSPVLFLVVIATVVVLTFALVRKLYHGRVRRADPWDCGYPAQTPRMQDTAEGFGQPISQMFEPAFLIERHLPDPADSAPYYRKTMDDRLWGWCYLPVARLVERVSERVGRLQRGRIHWYLLYSFVTLLLLLAFVR